MSKTMFTIQGNICGERIRLARAFQKPPMKQEDLAVKLQLEGLDMTQMIISRIEKNIRHVCDGELKAIAKVLGVTMDWLCGEGDDVPKIK